MILIVEMYRQQVPFIYRAEYNISMMGIEKLHPFDSGKWGKVVQVRGIAITIIFYVESNSCVMLKE